MVTDWALGRDKEAGQLFSGGQLGAGLSRKENKQVAGGDDGERCCRRCRLWQGSPGVDELPPSLRGKRERLVRLEAAKEHLEKAEAAECLAQEQAQRAEKKRQSCLRIPGCKPAPPEQKVNHDRKANSPDSDSRNRLMGCRDFPCRGLEAVQSE